MKVIIINGDSTSMYTVKNADTKEIIERALKLGADANRRLAQFAQLRKEVRDVFLGLPRSYKYIAMNSGGIWYAYQKLPELYRPSTLSNDDFPAWKSTGGEKMILVSREKVIPSFTGAWYGSLFFREHFENVENRTS